MIFQVKTYIKYLLNAKTKYSVHSPFVFNLITQCFESEPDLTKINLIKTYKKDLLSDDSLINITDFGAGSKIFKDNNRKISAIAKHAGISLKNSKLLLSLITHFKPLQILEIGTSLGLGTYCLSLDKNVQKVTTLEGCLETLKIAKKHLKKHQINKTEFIAGNFNKTLNNVVNNKKYDLIYFDGNHQKQATINYFEICLNAKTENSIFIFDDIHWSEEMLAAWKYIKNHNQVRLTITTYKWGIVFFRKEQYQKEHFILRV